MSNIYIQFIRVMSCAAPCAIATPDLYMLLKSVLYVINFLSTVPSWICIVLHDFTLVVEHALLAETVLYVSYGILWLSA
jgi:hypothetical protein